ncbi:hypothetical protein PG2093B_0140 [Bifidobacterium pseudolongum subsp. globosum]|uniref:Uncharacterized protein n=1 Tax=Bifidobacterium pseudolongum subsp. globosum TaxID=1690 RepID=A0A4Q5A3S5_9BIFI|nr:hypothetical protein PG2093B_0140 [Bifidobacterium pseudolongum subsp. globosum]
MCIRRTSRQGIEIKLDPVCWTKSMNSDNRWNCAVYARDTTQLKRLTNWNHGDILCDITYHRQAEKPEVGTRFGFTVESPAGPRTYSIRGWIRKEQRPS